MARNRLQPDSASRLVAAIALAAAGLAAVARAEPTPTPAPVPLFDDLGDHHHPVTTSVPAAQRYFDQGLRLYYGFNLPEATRAFEEAARLDPGCAMAWWGIALASGPNYNSPIDPERNARAVAAMKRASEALPAATPRERDYVEALAVRYLAEPPADRQPLDQAYATAMHRLAQRYPDDADAATLYAESLMDLRPWDLWTLDGKPQPGTDEIVAVLEGVLRREPKHPGANHLYIHAVEASPSPERGLASAAVLEGLVPGAGHLVHMPSHIYMRVGKYEQATESNRRAVAVDRAYIAREKPSGEYPMLYYPHNLDFLWAAASMEGRSADAIRAARDLAAETPVEMVRQMPDMEGVLVTPQLVLLRFGRWHEVLAEPAPPADLVYATALDRYARGVALVRQGKLDQAAQQLALVREAAAAMPPDRIVMQVNRAKPILELAAHTLAGELDAARGETDAAVRELREAVRLQDELRYMEPPPWYFPVRQALGAVLLAAGRPREAEEVYRQDLARNPDNGWSLLGLARSLEAQGDDAGAQAARARFAASWQRADVQLQSSVF
jgi:tetratricopeptide (TPR) repeat protein